MSLVGGLFWSVLIVGVTTLLAVAGALLVRRWATVEVLERHNEVAGFIYAVIGGVVRCYARLYGDYRVGAVLYVFCANASDGTLTAHPSLKGEHLQDIKGKKGFPLGQEIMRTATEEKINDVTYWWPRPGYDKPLEKHTFFTKVGDQDCGVGYYKE